MKREFSPYSDVPTIGRLRACLEFLEKQSLQGKVLVDIGSSNGLLISKLKNKRLKKVIGVDTDKEAVKFAKRNLKWATFFVSKADSLPIRDKSVDVVVMFDVIEHVPKEGESAAFKEVARILKNKGIFLMSTPNDQFLVRLLDPAYYFGHRHYKAEKIKELLKKAGFSIKKIEIKGNLWSSIYMLWFYIAKWIFNLTSPRNKWLEKKEDEAYNGPGIFTLFAESRLED